MTESERKHKRGGGGGGDGGGGSRRHQTRCRSSYQRVRLQTARTTFGPPGDGVPSSILCRISMASRAYVYVAFYARPSLYRL